MNEKDELEKRVAALEREVQELQERINQMFDIESFAKAMRDSLRMQSLETHS